MPRGIPNKVKRRSPEPRDFASLEIFEHAPDLTIREQYVWMAAWHRGQDSKMAQAIANIVAGSARPNAAGSAPPPAAKWQPAQPVHPEGQGSPVAGVAKAGEDPMQQYMADGDDPGEVGDGPPAETDPRFAPIGHYTSAVVRPIVELAMRMAKDSNVGAQTARELLTRDEPTCTDPPDDLRDGRGVATALDRKHCLKGNMGEYAWGDA